MPPESSRDMVIAKAAKLAAIKGVQARPSADPYRFVADDGQKFTNYPQMVAHNMGVTSRDTGNRTYEQTENRFYRRA